ncbi:NUDIX hydrolase [Riemerella columbina]|uniref:NUDIX hydrolase n=1 Tax=Riemerella columbina TaxID=103810 RepID=UPI00267088D0|nr:CoA pyrophosphatase [Riemerella columbina]WKS94330.1 CoA pyrophosphatase [Riemerella columbina]
MNHLGRDLLQKIKQAPLEGEQAHRLFSPPYRPLFSYSEILEKHPRWAAVNLLLYLKNNEWHLPLMVRSINQNDRHSGQISLPGGQKEAADHDFSETAIRETSEELGIERHYIRLIREMSPLYIPPSNFYVHTYISYTKKNPTFILQEAEAVELIELPISALLELTQQPQMMTLPGTKGIEVPVIHYQNYTIWGATSMILSEFSRLLKNV